MPRLLAVAAGFTLGASAIGAQARPCPPAAGEPYLVCQIDRPPEPDSTNAVPRYPDVLMRMGQGGTIRFAIVVDSIGRSNAESFTVVESANVLVTMAAQAAARTWRFRPGMNGGRRVTVRWEQIISFATPPGDVPLGDSLLVQRDIADDYTPRLHVGVGVPRPGAITTFAAAELLDAQRQALRQLAPAPAVDSAGNARITLCVDVSRGNQEDAADSGTLVALSSPGRRAVIPRDCPKTYAGAMWTMERAPAGHVDPYSMAVTRLGAWNADVLVMQIEVMQGSVPSSYQCWSKRQTPTWRTQCSRVPTQFY